MLLYMAVTLDDYQLPLFVGTRKEVAGWADLAPDNISMYAGRNLNSYKNNCKFVKVVINDTTNDVM